ncbi:MAG TPA: phage major capsid protein [Bryobacteraceae bacterium]|nr:phage major capsid protein [Bryobacteraceae bacterium]
MAALTLSDNRALREQRYAAIRAAQMIAGKPHPTSEERAHFDQLMREADAFKAEYELLESRDMYDLRNGGFDTFQRAGSIPREDPDHRAAFRSYLRLGTSEMPSEQRALLQREYRDMGTGGQGAYPGATSGFFVPAGFQHRIEEAMKYVGPMLNGGEGMPQIIDTDTGAPLPFPAADDTAQVGEQVGENQPVSSQDVNITQVMLGSFKYSSKLVKASLELMLDSAFDIETWLIGEFSRRLARILNAKLTNGVGTTEPYGIVTATVAGGNIVQAVGSSTNTGGNEGPNTIGSDDLTNLEHAVDPFYRSAGARYMLHDSTLKAIKKVKDKMGKPLWQESTRDGSPATINGFRYVINNDLDTLQTNPSSPVSVRRTVIFGDLSKYVVRRVRQMSLLRLNERFADQGQVGFLSFARFDGASTDIGHRALAVLENSY